jgi:1,4-dihydroxy-2-naphthoate octaprenyltransferase
MEKFLWNLGGYATAALSVFSLLLLMVRQDLWNALFCIVCFLAGWVYMRKRPTWLEV